MSVLVNIFILCHNEQVLLPHTIFHYRSYLPGCNITIYDNESTDNSVEIAKSLGCNIISWNSNNEINDYIYQYIKNNCWKKISDGWIIMIDMDEWLYVTLEDLKKEEEERTCILKVNGYNIVGTSERLDLSDVDIHHLNKGEYNKFEDKSLCFYRNFIQEMNYDLGAHWCNPVPDKGYSVTYSSTVYTNKHMIYLGKPFFENKMIERNKRSLNMRKIGLGNHYNINSLDEVSKEYYSKLESAISVPFTLPTSLQISSSSPP